MVATLASIPEYHALGDKCTSACGAGLLEVGRQQDPLPKPGLSQMSSAQIGTEALESNTAGTSTESRAISLVEPRAESAFEPLAELAAEATHLSTDHPTNAGDAMISPDNPTFTLKVTLDPQNQRRRPRNEAKIAQTEGCHEEKAAERQADYRHCINMQEDIVGTAMDIGYMDMATAARLG